MNKCLSTVPLTLRYIFDLESSKVKTKDVKKNKIVFGLNSISNWPIYFKKRPEYSPTVSLSPPHPHPHFIDITKYNHSINEQKYNMISNGWLKKGKIPVNIANQFTENMFTNKASLHVEG